MKNLLALLILLFTSCSTFSQIRVNGKSPRRNFFGSAQNSLSISYGNIFWVDGKNVPMAGYSEPLAVFHEIGDLFSVERYNIAMSVNFGYERQFSDRLALRASLFTSKLNTGSQARADLITSDKSKIHQLGLYGRYTLTNPERKFQVNWLLGPELMYAQKDVYIADYVADASSSPDNYRQNITVVEGALQTGFGFSYKIIDSFTIFIDGMAGISLPGKGFKSSNSGIGLKYNW